MNKLHYNFSEIINIKREVKCSHHLLLGRSWRLIGENELLHSPLVYASFEFRCSIERALIEMYCLISGNKNLTDEEYKVISKIKNVVNAIYNLAGCEIDLTKRIIFNNLFMKHSKIPQKKLTLYSPSKLKKFWHKLSDYCHRQLEPNITWDSMGNDWLKKGYSLLNQVEDYLWENIAESNLAWIAENTLCDELKNLLKSFLNNEINEISLDKRMEIIWPTLTWKENLKII